MSILSKHPCYHAERQSTSRSAEDIIWCDSLPVWRSHENKGQTSWHSWSYHMALPEALDIAVSRGRLSSQEWSHRHLLLLFAWRGIVTVPNLCLTVQGPPLPWCSNMLKEVCATWKKKIVISLSPIPLLPLDTGNLPTHGCCCLLFVHSCTWSSWYRQQLSSCICFTPAGLCSPPSVLKTKTLEVSQKPHF